MSVGLKLFWGAIASLLIAGLITLATIGIPSPSVDVKKKVNLENVLK